MSELDLSAKFCLVYCNLPLGERDQPVLVLNEEPISWKMVHNHVTHGTEIGKKCLEQLEKMEVI